MSSSAPSTSRNPPRGRKFAADYIAKHNLQQIFEDTINTVIAEDAEDPLERAAQLLRERSSKPYPLIREATWNDLSADDLRKLSKEAVVSLSTANISRSQLQKIQDDLRAELGREPWSLHVWFSTEIEDADSRLREWKQRVQTARVAVCGGRAEILRQRGACISTELSGEGRFRAQGAHVARCRGQLEPLRELTAPPWRTRRRVAPSRRTRPEVRTRSELTCV